MGVLHNIEKLCDSMIKIILFEESLPETRDFSILP